MLIVALLTVLPPLPVPNKLAVVPLAVKTRLPPAPAMVRLVLVTPPAKLLESFAMPSVVRPVMVSVLPAAIWISSLVALLV